MTWSIVIGNGFTIDSCQHCGIKESPTRPWNWPIKNPYNTNQLLLDVMPRLKVHLESQGELSKLGIYEALQNVIRETQSRPPYQPGEEATELDYVHLEACHYLRLAYAWYSDLFTFDKLYNWAWRKWFSKYGNEIETILSFNYDTVLETVMRSTYLGKVYGSSRQNFLFGPGLVPTEPEVYWDEQKGDKKVIHIAKPHGSCNFSGWGVREVSDEKGVKPLYPITMVMARDNTLKILVGSEIHKATSSADLILPGEWSWWNDRISTNVAWANEQKDHFIKESTRASKLLIIGFGYGEPDRPEFNDILSKLYKFEEVHIVDPSPSKELTEALEPLAKKHISVWESPLPLIN